jgi:hypothetical protein
MIGALVAGITGAGGAVASSYESIATATGTGSAGNLSFTSIPSTFKHLQIRYIARDTGAIDFTNFYARVNNDSGNNYARHRLVGDGSTATASGQATENQYMVGEATGASASSGIMGVGIIDILDYASTSKYKTIRHFTGANLNGSGEVHIQSALWMSTSAITQLNFIPPSSGWATTTTFALYGIKEA